MELNTAIISGSAHLWSYDLMKNYEAAEDVWPKDNLQQQCPGAGMINVQQAQQSFFVLNVTGACKEIPHTSWLHH